MHSACGWGSVLCATSGGVMHLWDVSTTTFEASRRIDVHADALSYKSASCPIGILSREPTRIAYSCTADGGLLTMEARVPPGDDGTATASPTSNAAMNAMVKAPDEPGVRCMRPGLHVTPGYVRSYISAIASRSGGSPRAAV